MPDLASTFETSMVDMSTINSADNSSDGYLFEEILSMENLSNLCMDDDDLPCHFQTDSGALACVGCGILGFPLMTVVQPSERSLMELLPANHHLPPDSSPDLNSSMHGSVSSKEVKRNQIPASHDKPINEHTPNGEGFEVPIELSAADLYDPVPLDAELHEDAQIVEGNNREINPCSHLPVEQRCEYPRREHAEVLDEVISDSEKQHQDQNENKIGEEPAPSYVPKGEPKSLSISKVIWSKKKNGTEVHLSRGKREVGGSELATPAPSSNSGKKRKREAEWITKDSFSSYGFARSPCEGLRPRAGKVARDKSTNAVKTLEPKMARKHPDVLVSHKNKKVVKGSHKCDIDGCRMSFKTKAELKLHKRNRCPHDGCGKKKFSSHKYAMIHQRVHDDERPFKYPWEGCSMSFKGAWTRTEHIRVHTREKPYQCKFEGCGLSFRFVSDYSRHRRKMRHYVK
ncbi:hypothetical protein L6164_005800 [Bauhinia variegata]|uniref:Uncharacterized protein n=1 Tax=Bauhinia variegata TaxID=167791 RepID=A0ACB9PSE8_BAUVA|nr:hypothetical protein L6164_005800 [Bauhinia variegata]